MRARHRLACLALLLAAGMTPRHAVRAAEAEPGCAAAIESAEAAARLPPGLLGAIAIVESGRFDPSIRRTAPWPWTINVGGVGSYYPGKQEAIAAVEAARSAGARSIDVGCLQINLLHHPDAFATLDDAFNPQANAVYAAAFLTRLFGQTRSWPEAAASYHSATPGLREDYQRRVMGSWSGATRFGYVPGAAATAEARRPDTPLEREQLAERRANRARWAAMGIIAAPAAAPAPRARPQLRLARLAEPGGARE